MSAVFPTSTSTFLDPAKVMRTCLGVPALALPKLETSPARTLANDGGVESSDAPGTVT
ncbi:hypothetical protein D3C83_274320 [compost metagenome]